VKGQKGAENAGTQGKPTESEAAQAVVAIQKKQKTRHDLRHSLQLAVSSAVLAKVPGNESFRECFCLAECQVKALSGYRVNRPRCISDKSDVTA